MILSDMRMPPMDGHTTLTAIKRRHPDPEVVILTGHAPVWMPPPTSFAFIYSSSVIWPAGTGLNSQGRREKLQTYLGSFGWRALDEW
jgi:hypothetical protein